MIQKYNFLIIGRCGSGKSATTQQLTGCQNIEVRNSPNSVTRQARYYQSTPAKMERNKVCFGVLDIPGLDALEDRKLIRQVVLSEMSQRKIDFDAILYTVDCVSRDTIDNQKVFHFLNQLPWSLKDTKQCLIPILTKYDNLIFDAEDETTKKTLQQFATIFKDAGYGQSWQNNSLYWVNTTKNIERKMTICNQIKEIYDSQLQKLLQLLEKKKTRLSRQRIGEFLEQQHRYIQNKVKKLIKQGNITLRAASCLITRRLTIEINHEQHTQNYTAATLGGMGVMLTKVVKNQIGKVVIAFGALLVAGGYIMSNLLTQKVHIKESQQQRHQLKFKLDKTYIIQKIQSVVNQQIRQYQQLIELSIQQNVLNIQIPDNFQGQFFTISKSSVTECYLEDIRLQRNQMGDFQYHFVEDEQANTLIANVKLRFTILLPEEQALLQRFQQESYNFKRQLDQLY